jgi:hypothetical protein
MTSRAKFLTGFVAVLLAAYVLTLLIVSVATRWP